MKRLLYILIIAFVSNYAYSQKVNFTGSAPKVVALSEQFNLTYEVNDNARSFNLTKTNDFNFWSGPNQSNSTSTQIYNGNAVTTTSTTFSYVLTGKKIGKFTIPPATVMVKGKKYKSNPVTIEVVKGRSANSKGNKQSNEPVGLSDDDLFTKVLLSKSKVYQGEHIIATVKVYSRTQNIKFLDIKLPSFDGFLTQEIEDKPNTLYRENYNGEIYYVGIFQKLVLFPQRTGTITIEPFQLKCQVSIRSGYRRDFFGRKVPGYKNMAVTINSPTRKIEVLPLPPNKPASFKGAIGALNMKVSINKTKAKTNEAINLKVKLTGSGNLKTIDPLDIKFPADFEVYEPKIKNNYKASDNGVSGSKTFDWLMIPRHAGTFTIPPFQFSYFNTNTKQYKTIKSKGFQLSIEKSDDDQNTTVVSGFSKEDVKFIGKDIHHIKTNSFKLKKKGSLIFGTKYFWLAYIIPLVIFIVVLIFQRKRAKENTNVTLMRNKRANKEAGKRLKAALAFLKAKNEDEFYQEILQALYGYLSDKLNIPLADLTKGKAIERLSQYKIDNSDLIKFTDLLNNCEFAQYAPSTNNTQMTSIYEEAKSFINLFENKIR